MWGDRMKRLLEYRDDMLYCHHTLDEVPQAVDFSVHTHEMMELYYFISGNGSYLVEGTQYTLHPGDVMIMREAEAHKLQIDMSQPYERIAIHFSSKLIGLFDPEGQLLRPFTERSLGHLNQYRSADFANPHWESTFQFFDFSASQQIRSHIIARLLSLLTELCDAYDKRCGTVAPIRGAAAELVSYVNEHLFEDISIKELSGTFFCSASQLMRMFRQATGTSISRYIHVKRLLAARAMLQRGESAGNVCSACGFYDYSAFFRAYKKQFSQSPRSDMTRNTVP